MNHGKGIKYRRMKHIFGIRKKTDGWADRQIVTQTDA